MRGGGEEREFRGRMEGRRESSRREGGRDRTRGGGWKMEREERSLKGEREKRLREGQNKGWRSERTREEGGGGDEIREGMSSRCKLAQVGGECTNLIEEGRGREGGRPGEREGGEGVM